MDRLPSINSILDGTLKSIEDTDDTKLMMALSIGIVNILKDDRDMDSINNVLAFSLTIPAEYSIMLIKDMQQNGINVEESSRWEEWVREFEYLLS